MSTNIAIKLTNISKEFKLFSSPKESFLYNFGLLKLFKKTEQIKTYPVLQGINLEIKKGERLGILGANGAGKSTLLKIISGLMRPCSGSMDIKGRVSCLFSIDNGINENLSGIENILKSSVTNDIHPSKVEAYIEDILDFSELSDVIHSPVYTYSLGMKMRLQFAMATAIKPEILIIDEVLGAGDAYFVKKSRERLTQLIHSGCTFLMVSHSMSDIQSLCDRAILIREGKIVKDDVPDKVIADYIASSHKNALSSVKKTADQWHDVSRAPFPYFVENAIIEQEKEGKDFHFSDALLEGVSLKSYSCDGKSLLKNYEVSALSKEPPHLFPGGQLSIRLQLNLENLINRDKIVLKFYDTRAICVASFDYNLKDLNAKDSIELLLSPLVLGSGNYQIALAIQDKNQMTQELYPNWFAFLVNYANESDPPLYHIPGEWQLGENGVKIPARISPYL